MKKLISLYIIGIATNTYAGMICHGENLDVQIEFYAGGDLKHLNGDVYLQWPDKNMINCSFENGKFIHHPWRRIDPYNEYLLSGECADGNSGNFKIQLDDRFLNYPNVNLNYSGYIEYNGNTEYLSCKH